MIEGLSPVLAALGNFVIGAVGGGVAGVFVADYLRRKGKVWCLVSEWEGPPLRDQETQPSTSAGTSSEDDIVDMRISFLLDLFNERAISTGLRGVGVALHKRGRTHPVIVGLSTDARIPNLKPLRVINLPPNSWTSLKVYGLLRSRRSMVEDAVNADKIELAAYFPDGKKFSYEIDPEKQRYLYYSPPLTRYQRGS